MAFILYLSIASAVFLIFCIQSLLPRSSPAHILTILDTSLLPEQAVGISDNVRKRHKALEVAYNQMEAWAIEARLDGNVRQAAKTHYK